MTDTNNEIVYHYCSLEVFKSIIENECLWLCDVQKSNDYQERIYFEQIMSKQLEHYIKVLEREGDNSTILEMFQSIMDAIQNPSSVRRPIYSCAFSYEVDKLGQWDRYGDGGYGVAIGFKRNIFEKKLSNEHCRKIEYHTLPAIQQCDDIIEQALNEYLQLKQAIQHDTTLDVFIISFLQQLAYKEAFFKSRLFQEENEWRLVTADPPSDKNLHINHFYTKDHSYSFSLPAITSDGSQAFQLSEKKFRVSNHKLSGYYELSFSNIKNDIISSILLGPKCLSTKQDIENFLNENGYETETRDSKEDVKYISINRSEITYC